MHKSSLLLLPALFLLAACQPKQDSAGLLPASERAPHFDETAPFLELGGVFYAFVDLTDKLANLGENLTEVASAVKETTSGMPPLPLDFSRFLSASGLSGLQAIGMSSREVEPGYFHNRSILLFPEGVTGLFTLFGDASGPFESTGIAPAGSDLVVEFGYRPTVARDTLLEMAGAVAGPFGSGAIASQLSLGRPELGGRTPNQLIESLGTRCMVILELVEDGEPIEIDPGVSIPEFQFVVGFDQLTGILATLQPAIESQPELTWTEAEDGFEITTEQVLPPPFHIFQPVIVADTTEDRVFLASTRDYLDRCLGAGEKLEDTDEFRQAMEGLPEEGISFSFASPELFEPLRQVFASTMTSGPTPLPEDFTKTLAEWSIPALPKPLAAVSSIEPNGFYTASNAANSHRTTVVSLAVQPIGLMAAMAIPAFQKVRENSRQAVVTDNSY